MKRHARAPAQLSESVHQRLNAYALAASAAGVGVLAQPAEAKIIYTPAHVVLTGVPHTSFLLDLNHDGINDFSISGGYYVFESGNAATLRCIPEGSLNGARVARKGKGFVMALAADARVGPSGRFNQSEFMGKVSYVSGGTGFYGPWVNGGTGVKDRYLGLKFTIKGETHYGWARVNVKVGGQSILKATLTGYAYETIPNKPIVAGKTHGRDDEATLGHLATGASAIPAWRAKPTAASTH